MREWLGLISDPVIIGLDALALLVIVVGTAEVSVNVVRAAIKPLGYQEARKVWLRYARWLVAALTLSAGRRYHRNLGQHELADHRTPRRNRRHPYVPQLFP